MSTHEPVNILMVDDQPGKLLSYEAVLAELGEKDRDILKAVFLEDVDKSEICERFQVDRDYLRVLVHRAKSRFRDAFEKSGMARP